MILAVVLGLMALATFLGWFTIFRRAQPDCWSAPPPTWRYGPIWWTAILQSSWLGVAFFTSGSVMIGTADLGLLPVSRVASLAFALSTFFIATVMLGGVPRLLVPSRFRAQPNALSQCISNRRWVPLGGLIVFNLGAAYILIRTMSSLVHSLLG
jgi:hypothetical protein